MPFLSCIFLRISFKISQNRVEKQLRKFSEAVGIVNLLFQVTIIYRLFFTDKLQPSLPAGKQRSRCPLSGPFFVRVFCFLLCARLYRAGFFSGCTLVTSLSFGCTFILEERPQIVAALYCIFVAFICNHVFSLEYISIFFALI